MPRDSRELIEQLLEHVREWSFDDSRGREENYCESCGATYRVGVFPKDHKPGCELKQLLDNARAFCEQVS